MRLFQQYNRQSFFESVINGSDFASNLNTRFMEARRVTAIEFILNTPVKEDIMGDKGEYLNIALSAWIILKKLCLVKFYNLRRMLSYSRQSTPRCGLGLRKVSRNTFLFTFCDGFCLFANYSTKTIIGEHVKITMCIGCFY